MKTQQPFTFEVTTRRGGIARWDGTTFVDATPRRTRVPEPVVSIRRAATRPDGRIDALVLQAWHDDFRHGTEVALDPVEFEHRRRYGQVRGVPRSPRLMEAVVVRPWKSELRIGQRLRLPESELFARNQRGECDFYDPRERALADPPKMRRMAFFQSVGIGGGVLASHGEVHIVETETAIGLEQHGVATEIFEGDRVVVDGELVAETVAAK